MNAVKAITKAGRKILKPAAKMCRKLNITKPEVFVFGGIAMVIGGFVWVAAESMKAPEVMTRSADAVKDVEDKYAAKRETASSQEETTALIKAEKKELTKVRIAGTADVVKIYIGPVILLLVGCGAIVKGHNILKARNAALAVMLKSTEKMFDFYRSNVIANQGKEADQRYMRGIVGEAEGKVLDENGNEIGKTETLPIVRPDNPWQFEFSPYYFRYAKGIPDTDLTTLLRTGEYFNHIYNGSKRYDDISMYEVMDYLGAKWENIDPQNKNGTKVFCRNYGWGHDPKGDPLIDLGAYRAINEAARVGASPTVYMVMNCDGRLEKLTNQYQAKYTLAEQ